MDRKVFVCVGLPCSGKGTQSRILAEKINAHRIESGARLDMIMRGETYPELSKDAQNIRINPRKVSDITSYEIERAKLGNDFGTENQTLVLDGFARKQFSYDILVETFGLHSIYFLWFHITQKTMYKRAEGRFIDPQTRQSFTGLSPEQATQLGYIKRESDTPEVLIRRLSSFRKHTERVLETHKLHTGKVYGVNAGHPKIEDVTQDMMSKIRHLV